MTLDPHSAAGAVGLANSALSAVKSAFELGKKTSDFDLKKHLHTALDDVLELKLKVHELAEENRILRERLEQKDSITRSGEMGYWFKEGETDPLCPKCYEESGKQVYLPPPQPWSGGIRRDCRVCSEVYWEKPMNLSPRSIRPYNPYS